MSPPGGKKAFGGQPFCIKKKRRRPKSSARAARERQRAVEEFIREKGVTRCPPGYSHMDW